jgi:hypothetical protein
MLSFSEDNEDGFSLVDCVRQDGSIDLQRALNFLADVEDECHVDESSVFSCMNAEGGLDLAKFLQVADTASLLELSILKEAGLLDDANTPTGATIETPLRPYKPRRARSNLYEIYVGTERRKATPKDSCWWKM